MAVINIVGSAVVKKLIYKSKKHQTIENLAGTALGSINVHLSKALEEGCISDSEFTKIQGEMELYRQTKEQIRLKYSGNNGVNEIDEIVNCFKAYHKPQFICQKS